MRVSQIQNLTWAGNVLVMGGLVFVGLEFWQARRLKPQKEASWPAVKAAEDPNAKRWPGEQKNFVPIWETPVSGKVPPPPAAVAPPPKLDRVAEFKQRVKLTSWLEVPSSPDRTVVHMVVAGKEISIHPGASVEDFKLLACSVEKKPDASEIGKAFFENPDTHAPFSIEMQLAAPPKLPGGVAFQKTWPSSIGPADVPEAAALKETAFLDPVKNEWVIPGPEQDWLEVWGQKDVWEKLATRPDVDAQGVSHGLRVMSHPEAGTPLATTHGIAQGDVIRSINGHPVTSKEEAINYLRGEGKGLERYEVVVETEGKPRTLVYRVSRTRPGSRD